MSADDPESHPDGAPALDAPKTWKALSGISYEFNSHVNAAYKHIHDALNDIYANTLDLSDLESLFTDTTFAAFKTQSVHAVNVVSLLSDLVYDRIAAAANPGSTNPDRISEILRECSLSFVDQTGSRKTFRTIAHFNQLLKATISDGLRLCRRSNQHTRSVFSSDVCSHQL